MEHLTIAIVFFFQTDTHAQALNAALNFVVMIDLMMCIEHLSSYHTQTQISMHIWNDAPLIRAEQIKTEEENVEEKLKQSNGMGNKKATTDIHTCILYMCATRKE